MDGIWISGFADEISNDFDVQLATVTRLGMKHISLRSADGKNVADYTPEEVVEKLLPRLKAAGVEVSSLGSPIGKINVDDEGAYRDQLGKLERLCKICKLLNCRYIRIFSFFVPEGQDPEQYRDTVIEKLKGYERVAKQYDVILLDCCPSLGMLTINALAAADKVIVPLQAHYLSIKGMEQLIRTISNVKRKINPDLEIAGILITMADLRTNYSREIIELLHSAYDEKLRIFESIIPLSIRAAETSAEGRSIYLHDPAGKVSAAYAALTREVLA